MPDQVKHLCQAPLYLPNGLRMYKVRLHHRCYSRSVASTSWVDGRAEGSGDSDGVALEAHLRSTCLRRGSRSGLFNKADKHTTSCVRNNKTATPQLSSIAARYTELLPPDEKVGHIRWHQPKIPTNCRKVPAWRPIPLHINDESRLTEWAKENWRPIQKTGGQEKWASRYSL